MCLSTVYRGDRPDPENLLAEYVTSVEIEADGIRLLDITGEEILVQGTLHTVDLIGNRIFITPTDA